jgi:hypothetical protein
LQQSAAADVHDTTITPDAHEQLQKEDSAVASKPELAAGNALLASMQGGQILSGAQLHPASTARDDDNLEGSDASSANDSAGSRDNVVN